MYPDKYYYNGKPLFEKLKDFIKEEGKSLSMAQTICSRK